MICSSHFYLRRIKYYASWNHTHIGKHIKKAREPDREQWRVLESCKFAHYVIISTRLASLWPSVALGEYFTLKCTCRRLFMRLLLSVAAIATVCYCCYFYGYGHCFSLAKSTLQKAGHSHIPWNWNTSNGLDKQYASLAEFVIRFTFIIANVKDESNWWKMVVVNGGENSVLKK